MKEREGILPAAEGGEKFGDIILVYYQMGPSSSQFAGFRHISTSALDLA